MSGDERRTIRRSTLVLAALPIGLLILFVFTMTPVAGLMPHLLLGWMDFIGRNVQQMRWRWEVIWSVLLYMAILLAGGHFFARWICRTWKWSWSVRGLVVFLLMFIVGTSAVGMVEQTRRLKRESLYVWLDCPRHLRQLGQWLFIYAHDHGGKYPEDLAELIVAYPDFDPQLLICTMTDDKPATGSTREQIAANARGKGHCSYLYFGKGRSNPLADDLVLICEDPKNHGGGMNALFGDGHGEWIREGDAQELFNRLTTTRPAQ